MNRLLQQIFSSIGKQFRVDTLVPDKQKSAKL